MNPLITVIIPVYNGENYIQRAVESIVNQPEAHLIDLLLINDGSQDNSAAICDQLATANANVRVIHKINGGVSSARNLGIENAKGKYVGFLDCDDWWEPGVFDCLLVEEMILEDSADVYQFSYREVNHDVSLEKRNLLEDKTIIYENRGFGRYDWSHHCSFFHLRSLLLENEVRYLMCKVGEDGPMVEMSLYHARSLKQMHRVLFTYWENYSSCVHTTDALNALKEQCKGVSLRKDYFEKFDVYVDEEKERIWQILTSLPRLCAFQPYRRVKLYMEEQCMSILDKREDIRFGDHLWIRVNAWRTKPYCYWLKQKIKIGIPMRLKKQLIHIPYIGNWINYLYTRYHRNFLPTKNQKGITINLK